MRLENRATYLALRFLRDVDAGEILRPVRRLLGLLCVLEAAFRATLDILEHE